MRCVEHVAVLEVGRRGVEDVGDGVGAHAVVVAEVAESMPVLRAGSELGRQPTRSKERAGPERSS